MNNSNPVEITRIVGNSIKLVRQTFIAEDMVRLIKTDNWQEHFEKLIEDSEFPSLNDKDPIVTKLVEAVEWHDSHAGEFRRQTLQIKLSETIDNFYLAMELTREYQKWKHDTVDRLLFTIKEVSKHKKRSFEELKETLRHNIDTLWFEACLEVLRNSGIYDTDSKNRIPIANLINSRIKESLKSLSVGESFRIAGKESRKLDVILKQREGKLTQKVTIFARNADGTIQRFDGATDVFREGCLTRSIDGDGDGESIVAVATSPVSQYVNHHSISVNNQTKGYVFVSIGDEQSTSHFMHYSALSGGCSNIVQFNRFLRSAMEGVSLTDRVQLYSKEASWSNGEIIQRGIMGGYGQDGLLRPGFSNKHVLRYVWRQIIEGKQNIENILSRDWIAKFATAMIPGGMSLNKKFTSSLKDDANRVIFDMFLEGAMEDDTITWSDGLEDSLKARRDDISYRRFAKNHDQTFWEQFLERLTTSLDEASHKRLKIFYGQVAKVAERFVSEVIDFAISSHLYDRRNSQELWNQPKPVDSIVGDYAADGRDLPNYLAQSTTLSAASVALVLYAARQDYGLVLVLELCSVILSMINIFLSARILINGWKYKIRNGEARAIYLNQNFVALKKAAFSAMDTKERRLEPDDDNPFLEDLEEKKKQFVDDVIHYGLEDPDEFIYDYRRLMERSDQAAAFKHFQKRLVTYYLPDVYQSNSYVQESLVEVYKACDEVHTLLSQDEKKTGVKKRDHVTDLFHRVREFGPRLQESIGARLMNTSIYLALRYFWSLICLSSAKSEIPMTPIETETYGIIRAAHKVRNEHKGSILKREIPDLEYLHRAIVETDKGAVIFLSAFLFLVSSCLFVLSRILKVSLNETNFLAVVGLWSQLSTGFPAFLSFRYFVFYLYHSLWLWVKLGVKLSAAKLDKSESRVVTKIQGFILVQFLLTIIRICVVLSSATAIFWCVAMAYPQWTGASESSIPLFIAMVAFGLAIVATSLFWFIEFAIGYKLPPNLGEIVCEIFRDEIEYMYEALSIPENKFDTTQAQERTTWEYVAREFLCKYRFDAVFGPDRVSSILQCLQCDLEKSEENVEGDNLA